MRITAHIDSDDGTFTVDVGTDDLPAAAADSEGRSAIDVRLNGISLTTDADSSS